MMVKRDDKNPFGIEPAHIKLFGIGEEGSTRRKLAYEVYRQISMPTKKDRAWRKTIIDEFNANDFVFKTQTEDRLNHKIEVEEASEEIIIHYHPRGIEKEFRNDLEKSGIFICSLMEAEKQNPQQLARIAGKIVLPQESKFSALTQTLDSEGLFMHIPKGKKVETPIRLIIGGGQSGKISTFHLIILLEEDSSATILTEWNLSKKNIERLLTGVVEIRAGKNAHLELTELQTWPRHQWTFLHERAELHENSHLDWNIYADGGKYSRTYLGVNLVGTETQAKITGISLNANPAQLDFDTFQHHHAESSQSDLLFNSAFANNSRSVWSGMIRVEKDALKTDAYQANRNLILCGDPLVESIPGLEILTDDVRCSHGVSAGEIDAEQLFYLASRGIPEKEAKRVIAQGFLNSGLARIGNVKIRERIENKIQSGLEELFYE